MSLSAYPIDQNPIGFYRVYARPPGSHLREITLFRGAPIVLNEFSTTDPFSESTGSISLPQISIFDTPGTGDLDWLVEDADIDVVWQNYGSYDYDWRWEGFITSYDAELGGTDSSFEIDLKGCLFALDNYTAKPTFPRRPIPYEVLISKSFNQNDYPARLNKLRIKFPDDWQTLVPTYDGPIYYQSTLKPAGVVPGEKWTGLVSRNTGSWEPMLSGFVQSLLTTMFDEGGSQWCIRNRGLRRPILFLRKPPPIEDPTILEITVGAPGVQVSATKDYGQRANIIYGQGKDEAGITYSGIEVSPRGGHAYFKPFAWSPLVYPREANPALDSKARPKETMIRFQDGLDQLGATRVAEAQLQRFTDPGFTGTITLQTDPLTTDNQPFPRLLIKAGTTVRLKGFMGHRLLAHVTQATANLTTLTMSLTFDTKYRDALTVDEVRARTRDALTPLRALQVGKFSNTVQDLLYPWNYKEGSGVIPSGGDASAKEFFGNKLPVDAVFPWEDWTKKFPPKDYPSYYIKIGKTDTTNATNNWCGSPREGQINRAIPVRMGYSGEIMLTQIAAYDRNGNVMPVRFHVSFYKTNGVGPYAMPRFWKDPDNEEWLKPGRGVSVTYSTGQSYPFLKKAWEPVNDDGTEFDNGAYVVPDSAGFVVGWGTYYEPAGYSPGRFSRGSARTGLLVDNTPWSWDLSENFGKDKQNDPIRTYGGSLFVEIYCDEQGDEPVFFLGHLNRTEPGTQ